MRTILPILLLSGCSLIQPKPTEVKVAVSVPCVTSIPPHPDYTFNNEGRLTERVKQLLIDTKTRDAYELELLAVIDGCI